MKVTVLILALFGTLGSLVTSDKPVFCYWGSWSHYRPVPGQFRPEHIDTSLCTHVFYTFFGISSQGGVRFLDEWLDISLQNIQKTVALKSKNSKIKIIPSIGGFNEGSNVFSAVAASATLRETFASNILNFVQRFNFDGIDLDWEYPGQRGGDPSRDKANFILFLQAIYRKLNPAGYLVTIATSCAESSVAISYDLPKIYPVVDFLLVMSYDLHGSWDSTTGHNAPLYAGPQDTSAYARTLNVNASISYFLRQGFKADKLVMGIPLYGRTFKLSNAARNGVGAPSSGPGNQGTITWTPGTLGYHELCQRIAADGYQQVWDSNSQVPFAFKNDQWITYDNVESVTIKAKYALEERGLGGVMVWSIETDDFRGTCGNGAYPLLTAVNKIAKNIRPQTTTSPRPTTTTTRAPITTPGTTRKPGSFPCERVPFSIMDPQDCNKWYKCFRIGLPPVRMACPASLYFNEKLEVCDWPWNVRCSA